MRRINEKQIENAVCQAALKANFVLRKDILSALKAALNKETTQLAKDMLGILVENAKIAKNKNLAICQDTGIAVVFCQIGNKLQVSGDITKAINNGIKMAYRKGYLRKSVVNDPFVRKNTNTNTPAVIHYDIIHGDKIKLTVLPKGFGSENASFMKMFNPTVAAREITEFIVNTAKELIPNACPPVILGIGIGGTMDKACLLAKEALLGKVKTQNEKHKTKIKNSKVYKIEKEIFEKLNKTGIGPMGLGGKTTCLGVKILTYPTHIAGLPVCVNVSCHALRSASVII